MNVDVFAKYLITNAKELGTSDIHILPELKKYKIYFRLSGKMNQQFSISKKEGERLISYFKYLANMDVGEKRRPQSGSLAYKIKENFHQDLRLSTITDFRGNESLVFRLLEVQKNILLEKSTFLIEELELMRKMMQYKSGLILFSGPVNSGKTTTMYELVREQMKNSNLQVVSIEDPVEITEKRFFQVQVNNKAGNTYEEALKACLRHHPDIIIVGEIRDEETAKMVLRGALTGHLILASVHAKNAEGVIYRLNELGISIDMLKQTLIAIIFQKLLPIYCGLCEDNCRTFCSNYPINQKRATLYDVLSIQEIQNISIHNKQSKNIVRQRNFNHLLKKVYMNGFITRKIYEQYIIP